MELIHTYKEVQDIAKRVHSVIGGFISPESSELSIAKRAAELLADFGAPETWYHNVPAFVLLGSRSCLSISGRDYIPSNEEVGYLNLVTVDLSPKVGSVWGDCARSYAVENGAVAEEPSNPEFIDGIEVEKALHRDMINFVSPETKFSHLFEYANSKIKDYGYENLDFLLNLGHSIEVRPEARRFIDKNSHEKLGSVSFFTFEPYIKKVGSSWGFKHEEIYYFNGNGRAVAL